MEEKAQYGSFLAEVDTGFPPAIKKPLVAENSSCSQAAQDGDLTAPRLPFVQLPPCGLKDAVAGTQAGPQGLWAEVMRCRTVPFTGDSIGTYISRDSTVTRNPVEGPLRKSRAASSRDLYVDV